jgi:transcriptional regulator with XRE-family HTH domain
MGVSKQFLLAVEHGKTQVGIDSIKQIARIVDTHVDSLLEMYFHDDLIKHVLNMNFILKKAS